MSNKMYKELASLAAIEEWAMAHRQTPEQMWPVEKEILAGQWTGHYTVNALAPIHGSFSVTIEHVSNGKWVVFHEEDGAEHFEKSYKTLRGATGAAREFAEFFYDCYIENND